MAAAEPAPESLNVTIERIDELIALFNRKGMDIPAGVFARSTQFLLNGTAYETLLGRSPTDPLILMLARGAAGYRFIVKAVQHAVPDAAVQRGELVPGDGPGLCRLDLWLSGHLREIGEPIHTVVRVALVLTAEGAVDKAAATVEEPALDRLRVARRSP
jgi:hypothetical protein